jgi:biotin synthase
LLTRRRPDEVERIREHASRALRTHCGDRISVRGLLEFSNHCVNDCYYCGIRAGNTRVQRYTLSTEEILQAADECVQQGYASMMLQAGECRDEQFVAWIESLLTQIKERTRSEQLPDGLGVTLGIGEQSEATYARLFSAGAHRYLLRIETTDPALFRTLHPKRQRLESRIEALRALQRTGFQVGTGVMIGLPGQTPRMLAEDILFFKDMDIDMFGMGPYIPHNATPMYAQRKELSAARVRYLQSLLMIACTRLVCSDANIAATTALETLDTRGKQDGLRFGANVVMPQVSPACYRKNYLLYDGKPCEAPKQQAQWQRFLEDVEAMGRYIAYNDWGDTLHVSARRARTH